MLECSLTMVPLESMKRMGKVTEKKFAVSARQLPSIVRMRWRAADCSSAYFSPIQLSRTLGARLR